MGTKIQAGRFQGVRTHPGPTESPAENRRFSPDRLISFARLHNGGLHRSCRVVVQTQNWGSLCAGFPGGGVDESP
jgi:hypothetical protein